MNQNRITELKELLIKYRVAYYNHEPLVSDDIYDAMHDELSELEPEADELKKVGAEVPKISVWDKEKHEIPMGSLNKVNSKNEFIEWTEKVNSINFMITHKIDGSSMELVYIGGILRKCVTRGDGIIGENVYDNIINIQNIPKKLPGDFTEHELIVVRGEVVMMKDVFESKYSEEYANPRNTAAGLVRQKSSGGTNCKDLSFLAYMLVAEDQPSSYDGVMECLKVLGFTIPWYKVGTTSDICSSFETTTEVRESIPYEIDGMVVSIVDLNKLKELGDKNLRPIGQIAWKFDASMRETKITDVRWQVGPSGAICPVAVVEPINIGGVVIKNISLHNLKIFRKLSLSKGCRVLISRRNDCIPYCEKNLDNDNVDAN